MEKIEKYNIEYEKPKVTLLQESGLGVAEIAARTCYDSFENSENESVKNAMVEMDREAINSIENSDLLSNLAWVHHHHSIIEHATLSYLVQGTSRACYSRDTEVLTREGWKLFKNTTEEDLFLTRNDDGTTQWQKASEHIAYEYKGKMHRYKTNAIDLLVTPNHRMLFKRTKGDIRKNREDLHYMASEDIKFKRIRLLKTVNYSGKGVDIKIPDYDYTKRKSNGKILKKTSHFNCKDNISFLKLLASYLSDGSVTYNKKEHKYTVNISTPYLHKQEIILKWCNNLGIHAYICKKHIRFNHLSLGKFLKSLGKSHEKYIPFDVFDMTKKEANTFIDTYLQFDGTINLKTKQGALYTSSKQLSNDLYNICLIAGYTPNLHIIDNVGKVLFINGKEAKCNYIAYQIGISFIKKQNQEPSVYISKANKSPYYRTEEEYDGMVYCVSVPNTNLYVRREGTGNSVWCGNCLQEHARHRIQAISVRSTRYTMSSVINAFVASTTLGIETLASFNFFLEKLLNLNLFVITNKEYLTIEIRAIYDKLVFQYRRNPNFLIDAVAKSSIPFIEEYQSNADELFNALEFGKKKRNVGDAFKHIVSDNWKVDMVVTFNIRSLKNYFDLRDSGAAWFQIQWLAQEMKSVTPLKYLKLISKEHKNLS